MPTTKTTSGRPGPSLDAGTVEAIVQGRHGDPFSVLGRHGDGAPVVRTFQPQAARVSVVDDKGAILAELERVHAAGLFEGGVKGLKASQRYRLRLEAHGRSWDVEDPYRFDPVLGEMDVYLLAEGRHLRIFEKLGAHPFEMDGVKGTAFAVWAPNASRVSVVGPFNDWDGRRHPMRKRHECGVWELFIPGLERGQLYKYELLSAEGRLLPLKADPVAFRAEHPPATASVIHGLIEKDWHDQAWMARRKAAHGLDAPISVYEVHLGSWMRVGSASGRFLSYDELGDKLVAYVKELGFTHVEFMPVSEYPFDGSWGYQPIGLFAPTIRHGTPEEFAGLVERFHKEGIGVIIDWVPGHFPTDAHGLGRFDGTALYEHEDPQRGFHQDWNTLIYNYGRTEVANFLHANALYWLEKFHIDGIRVDAVASMLYLDYSRKEGEWTPNIHGGNENLEAIAFIRRFNELVYGEHDGAVTIAEESTAWPSVSRPTYVGGLGFGYKWNMGWMHDSLTYIGKDTVYRRYHQHNLTFGLLYAFTENFVLPLSHDEVVHGKGSLYTRMPGDRWQKFANLRAYFGFMWTHPGKKLLFMGGEFGQEREWSHERALDWHLLDDPLHKNLQQLVRDLNHLYRNCPPLHELDCEPAGFEWIDASDTEQSVISFIRRARDPERYAVVICNFTPVVRHGYRIGVPMAGRYIERLNTDAAFYGGSNVGNGGAVESVAQPWHGRDYSILVTLPPLATTVFEFAPL